MLFLSFQIARPSVGRGGPLRALPEAETKRKRGIHEIARLAATCDSDLRRKEPIVPNAAPSLSEGTLAATYQRGPARHEDASEEFLFCNAAEIEITFLNRQLLTHYMGNNSRRTPELQGAIR